MKKLFWIPILVVVAACGGAKETTTTTKTAGLMTFSNCKALGDYLESHAGKTTPSKSNSGTSADTTSGGTTGGDGASAPVNADSPAEAAPTAPNTTVVEEADIVKHDGNRLYVVHAASGLLIYDVSDAAHPAMTSQTTLSDLYPLEFYVRENVAAVIGVPRQRYDDVDSNAMMTPPAYTSQTRILLYDVSDAAAPSKIREIDLAGSYSDSRKVDGAMYVAVQNYLETSNTRNLNTILEQRSPCDSVYVPEGVHNGSYATYTSWDLVGLNLDSPNDTPTKVSVVGTYGTTLYATASHFYMASVSYEGTPKTGVYLFDLNPQNASATPRANAWVPGYILNQFSMDEANGVFRVVSTQGAWGMGGIASTDGVGAPMAALAPEPVAPTSSITTKNYLTTFKADAGDMTQLAQIDTIVPGENITAARFLGNRAFVTTFVQTDPLVALDLSNPTAPKVMGELHLPGRTDYLQAWGDHYLIAIGSKDWSHLVLNLFDISDLSSPKLVEQEEIMDAYSSEAQYEHLAFSFFEDRSLLVIPVNDSYGSSIRVFSVDEKTGFTPRATIRHSDLIAQDQYWFLSMRRSLEIGDMLYTVSEAGLKVDAFSALSQDLYGELFPDYEAPEACGSCAPGADCAPCPNVYMSM